MIFPFASVYIIKGNLCLPPRHLHNHLVPCFGCGKPGRHYRHFQQSFDGLYSGRHGHARCCFFDPKKLTWNLKPWRKIRGCRTCFFGIFLGGERKDTEFTMCFLENVNETNTKGNTYFNCSTVRIWTMELYIYLQDQKKRNSYCYCCCSKIPKTTFFADALFMESVCFLCLLLTCTSPVF